MIPKLHDLSLRDVDLLSELLPDQRRCKKRSKIQCLTWEAFGPITRLKVEIEGAFVLSTLLNVQIRVVGCLFNKIC